MNYDYEKFADIQREAIALYIEKDKKYGQAYKQYGVIGLLIRLQDKLSRYINIEKNKIELAECEDESLRDTMLDFHNYAAMVILLLDEEKYCNCQEMHYDSETGDCGECSKPYECTIDKSPLTEEDIRWGQEIAEEYGLVDPIEQD
jgi:hypothetical protein